LNLGEFDHVFLMGPLYHLLAEKDLYVSFVLSFAGVIYDLKNGGCLAKDLDPNNAIGKAFAEAVASQKDYAGMAFTDVFFIDKNNLEPFMAKFPLRKRFSSGRKAFWLLTRKTC
jgi:hypothetical protein